MSDLIQQYFKENHEPIKCTGCGSESIKPIVIDALDGHAHEKRYDCQQCNKALGFWIHGNFDPCYYMAFLNGTTNAQIPFIKGERIVFAEDEYEVVSNHGDSGEVIPLGAQYTISRFMWVFEGESCRRVVDQ